MQVYSSHRWTGILGGFFDTYSKIRLELNIHIYILYKCVYDVVMLSSGYIIFVAARALSYL